MSYADPPRQPSLRDALLGLLFVSLLAAAWLVVRLYSRT